MALFPQKNPICKSGKSYLCKFVSEKIVVICEIFCEKKTQKEYQNNGMSNFW